MTSGPSLVIPPEGLTIPPEGLTVPATDPPTLARVRRLEALAMIRGDHLAIVTEHTFHAGVYARTVRLAPGTLITGALMKRATLLIVSGRADMVTNDGIAELDGYNVLPASAGRKQVFLAIGEVAITMLFRTQATTVDQAEREFTDEIELLLSRRQPCGDTVTYTGE